MPRAVFRRMVCGVSTRDYEQVVDLARDGFGVAKSSVSRDFVRASATEVQALAERRFDNESFPVLMIDGRKAAKYRVSSEQIQRMIEGRAEP